MRDDRPFGGADPPAAVYAFSRDRGGMHPERHLARYGGILQADARACPRANRRLDPWAGFNGLYRPDRTPAPIVEASCWSHARRKFFVLADLAALLPWHWAREREHRNLAA